MKMKRISIITVLILVLFTASCTDDFLDSENVNSLTVDNWYQTLTDFQLAVNSAYACFAERGMFGLEFQLLYSTYEDRIIFETTARDRISIFSNDESIQYEWRNLYMGIYRCTRLLQKLHEKGLENIKNMNQADYDYIEAQARALRGGYYYYLITIFDRPILINE